jgi:pSer/pThr/pTyr-binding forkhead associated (FHA) protein
LKVTVFKNGQQLNVTDFGPEVLGLENESVRFLLGRSAECHVVLDDKMVSRELAEIEYDRGSWNIKRLSNKSDLKLNGNDVNSAQLTDGDVLSSGSFSINVELPEVALQTPVEEAISDGGFEEAVNQEVSLEEETISEAAASDETEMLDNNEFESDEFANDQFPNSNEESDSGDFSMEEGGEEDYSQEEYSEDGSYDEGYGEGEYGSDDDYALAESDSEKTSIIQTFAMYKLELFGEHAPYDSYLLADEETFIGRHPEKCQIVINDPEVSSVHAVVRRKGALCSLEDLQSGNGTLLNGERVNKVNLQNGDEFIIGGTTFTFKVGSDFLVKEKDTLMPVEENQIVEVEEVVEVDPNLEDGLDLGDDTSADDEKSIIKKIMNDPVKRKKAIYALVGLVVLWVVFDDGKPPPQQKPKIVKKDKKAKKPDDPFSQLSDAKKEKVESLYLLAKELVDTGRHTEALEQLGELHTIIPSYKQSKQLEDVAKQSLAKIEELARKKEEELQKKLKAERVKKLVAKAQKAVADRNVPVAEQIFQQVSELDPNNYDIPLLRSELDAWKKGEEKKKVEEAQRKAERKRKEDALKPGKNYYIKKDWYKAILELEKFLEIKDMDEDLIKEGTSMLDESRKSLGQIIDPLVGKARSLVEGQDLKGAYEEYKNILKHDPTHVESLNEMDRIRELLLVRSRRAYREAILAESLSLFNEAKEKFQEVQQISPSDSEYYKKATDKLKDYIDK